MPTGRSQARLRERYGVDSAGEEGDTSTPPSAGAFRIFTPIGTRDTPAIIAFTGYFPDGVTITVTLQADDEEPEDFTFDIEEENLSGVAVAAGLVTEIDGSEDFSATRGVNGRVLVWVDGEVETITVVSVAQAPTAEPLP